MAPRSDAPDETFLPFNFSSILSFDSVAAALSELPTPRIQEPHTPDAVFLNTDLHCHPPDEAMEQHLLELLVQTAQDSNWDLDSADDARAALSSLSGPHASPWEARLYRHVLRELNQSRRHHRVSRPLSTSARKPPKRPRRDPVPLPAPLNAHGYHRKTASPVNMRTEPHTDLRTVQPDLNHVHAAPSSASPHHSESLAKPHRPDGDTHLRELRLQQESNVVDTDQFTYFTNLLNRFISKARSLAATLNNRRHGNLQVTSNFSYLTELRQNIVLHAEQGAIARAHPHLLAETLSVLDTRIWESCKQCRPTSDSPRPSSDHLSAIRLGFLASSIVLSVLCAPDAPRSLFVEERLEKIAALLEEVSSSVIYPNADPLYRTLKMGTRRKSTSKSQSSPTRAFSSFSGKASRTLLESCCSLYDGITTLFTNESHLPESFASRCATSCISSFSIANIARLHVHSMRTLCAIFASDNDQVRRLWILDTVVSDVATKMPPDRRQLRRFQAPGAGNEVRVSSALIAELLCLASYENEKQSHSQKADDAAKDPSSASWSARRRREYDRAAQYSVRVWESFFKRSLEKEVETRSAFHILLEDILVLYGRPEWPSTELMLQTLSVSLISRMRAEKEKSALLRAFSIEVLGTLATRMCVLYGDEVVQTVPETQLQSDNESLEGEREKVLMFLDPSRSLLFKAGSSFYDSLFAADDLALAKSQRENSNPASSHNYESPGSDSEDDGTPAVVVKQSMEDIEAGALERINNVERRRARREEVREQEAIAAAKSIGIKRCFAKGFRTLLDAILDGMQDHAPSVRAKSIRALSLVDEACDGILRVLPDIIVSIEASCKDVSTLARDAALDLLSRSLLRNVSAGDDDESMHKVDVGQALMDQTTPRRVFAIVKERLRDTSTSVRKRAVSIMKAVLADALERSERSLLGQAKSVDVSEGARRMESRIVDICICLVPRLDDSEASVREASERTLRLGLFGFDVFRQTKLDSYPDAQAVAQVVERLQAVLSSFPIKSHHSIMARAFQGSILADHKQFVVGIVNASVHRLRDYEDILADLPQGRRPTELSESDRKQVRIVSAKKQACCSVLRAFSELDSSLLRSHCQSLAPIIKGMLDGVISHSDLGCVDCVLHILELAVGAHGDWDVEFLEELMRDVEHIVCTSPVQIVEEAAVRCLCVVTHKSASAEASESLERTTRNFMSFLNSEKDAIEESARVAITATQSTNRQEYVQLADIPRLSPLEKNSRCALVRLGLLIRFGDFAEELVSEAYDTIESICDMLCTSFPSHTLARSSVRALTHVLIRHRSLLAKGTRVLVSALENSNLSAPANGNFSSSGDGLALCVLEGFRELLRDEEERNSRSKIIKEEQKKTSTKAANRKGEKPKCAVSAEQESTAIREDVQQPQLGAEEDAEAGYLALSAQTMIARLETAVHSAARPVRQVVAHILGLLVRQGLVLPATVIPSLFCLLLDGDPSCREFSYRVISFLADRHSDMLASAALPGLRRCFESSFAVRYGRPPLVKESEVPGESLYTVERILKMAADEKSGQSLLSQAIMSMRKDKRRGVLESLIREFDPRISVRKKSSKRTKNEVFAVHRENGLFEASTLDTEVAPHAISEVDDKDDDVIPAETGEIDITISGRLCSIPTLYFFAATMASIDYTDGAGVGGSLTQGGGTAAADSKLKYAKEEVSHLVGVATRIISNSGQATLHAAGYVRRREYQNGHAASLEKRDLVLQSAARISLLLLLKKHLKVTRFMPVVDTVEMDSIAQGPYGMPPFHPVGAMHQAFVDANRAGYDSAQADALFNLFSTLMREDAIDEADVTLASRVGRGARGSAKRAVTKRVRSKHGERGNSEPRRKRPGRQAAQDASRKFRVDLDESE